MKRYYGDQVVVHYYDMAIPENHEQHKALLAKVPDGYQYYPLVFVDDEFRLAGSAEYYDLLFAVREVLMGTPQM